MTDHRSDPVAGDTPVRWTDDGKPALESGEPVLQRWFAILMVLLVPVGIGFAIWAFLSIDVDPIPVAERLPPGTTQVTHERGTAVLGEDVTTSAGPACASGVTLVGDETARAAASNALDTACTLMRETAYGAAAEGLVRFVEREGMIRFAIFELTGVDHSMRVEDDRLVLELNSKFQFRHGAEVAPFVLHALAHLADGWPGEAVSAEDERDAMFLQLQACQALRFQDEPPRGCSDALELIELDDTVGALVEAGYRREG